MSDRSRGRRTENTGRRRPRRLLWTFGLLLVAVGLVAWFAPTIVASTSLRQRILPKLFPEAQAEFYIGSASLSWLSPVELSNVEARDEQGEVLLSLERVALEKTLWDLLQQQSNIGNVTITGATANAQLREDGSNLEDAFGPLFTSTDDSSPPSLQIELLDGTIELHDLVADRTAEIAIDRATLALAPGSEISLQTEATGTIKDALEQSGFQLAYQQTRESGAPPNDSAAHQLQLATEQAPLRAVAGLIRRAIGPGDVAGYLASDVTLSWITGPDPTIEVNGRMHGSQIQFAATELLGSDVVACENIAYSGRTRIEPHRVLADNALLESEHGRLLLSGAVPRGITGSASLHEALLMLAQQQLQATGEIDLARLAAALPGTLQIRQDTKITGGKLTFGVDCRQSEGRQAWQAHFASSDITAETGGKAVVWNRPISLQAAAHMGEQGPVIDRLVCESDFIHIAGDGNLHDAALTARADLTALSQQLGQFLDLSNTSLRGQIEVAVRLSRDADPKLVHVKGTGNVRELQVGLSDAVAVQETELSLKFNGRLTSPEDINTIGLNDAAVAITAGEDVLTLQLLRPMLLAGNTGPVALRIKGQGALDRWANRLAFLAPIEEWQLQGGIALTADVELHPGEIRLLASQCDLANLVATGHGYHVREQSAQASAVGTLSLGNGQGAASLVTLATTSWSVRGDNVSWQQQPEGPPVVNGRFALRSDIRRTLEAFQSPRQVSDFGVRGIATGNVLVSSSAGKTNAQWQAQVENLVVETAAGHSPSNANAAAAARQQALSPVWTERQLKLTGQATYEQASDDLQVQQFEAETTSGKIVCAGDLNNVTSDQFINISGQATYNLAALMHRIRPLLGEDVQLTGADTATFAVYGPLFAKANALSSAVTANGASESQTNVISPELQASARFSWDSAQLYGLSVGGGELDGQLRHGILQVKPLSLAVSDGMLTLTPRVYLHESPPVMTLDRGSLLQNVQLTPDLCRRWLKYVAPLLADATECQGRISADVETAVFPVSNPESGNLNGMLTIHGADVRPGPLAGTYIDLVRRIQGALQGRPPEADSTRDAIRLVRLDEQQLLVNMSGGRVHHQGLTMKIGDVPVVTSGSVGMDQSLDLIASIAVQDSWIEGRSYLVGLQGQSLQVPIRGTVGRPRVDMSIIEDLGRKTVTGAAARIFRREINGLLGDLIQTPAEGGQQLQPPNNPLFRYLTPPDLSPPTMQPPRPTAPLQPPEVQFPSGNRP